MPTIMFLIQCIILTKVATNLKIYRGSHILFWILVLIPIIEVSLFIQVGQVLGLIPTVSLIIGTAFLGIKLIRKQGLAVFGEVQIAINSGRIPAGEFFSGLLIAVGGALLLTPGFITDGIGFFLLIPRTRAWFICFLIDRYREKIFHREKKQNDYIDHNG